MEVITQNRIERLLLRNIVNNLSLLKLPKRIDQGQDHAYYWQVVAIPVNMDSRTGVIKWWLKGPYSAVKNVYWLFVNAKENQKNVK